MSGIFRFKQFEVDQSGCGMKINTDGVLVGAIAGEASPENILDIGTGTGVIALMLAQRFQGAIVDAVEIDNIAAQTARLNFVQSPFKERLAVYNASFSDFFEGNPDKKYDLIVSNPPFYINSLISPQKEKNIAKHAGGDFFTELVRGIVCHLSPQGECWLILPVNTSELVKNIAIEADFNLHRVIAVKSFEYSEPHRVIMSLTLNSLKIQTETFVIYKDPKVYSDEYIELLKNFLTIF